MWNKIKLYCQNCGKEITGRKHNSKGHLRKYCSFDCAKKAQGYKTYGVTTCLFCGKPFQETRERPNKFCSVKCSGLYYGKLRIQDREESERFVEDLFCRINSQIGEMNQQLRILESAIQNTLDKIANKRQCAWCGKWYVSRDRKTYCSDLCARKADNYRRDHRNERNGKPDNSVTLPRLFIRDEGICQICGKPLTFETDSNSDDYPSIDHIRPLSRGGLHQWDNVQLACRKCNSLKSDQWEE